MNTARGPSFMIKVQTCSSAACVEGQMWNVIHYQENEIVSGQ